MAKYSYITDKSNNDRKIQVESAKRDGSGKNIENNYAKQNGYYSTLTAGQAEAIASSREIEDAEIVCPPITFGIAGGEAEIQTGINNLEYLEGKSIKFNQLYQGTQSFVGTGMTITLSENNSVITFVGTCGTVGTYSITNATHTPAFKFENNHKYLGMFILDGTVDMSSDGSSIRYDAGAVYRSRPFTVSQLNTFNNQLFYDFFTYNQTSPYDVGGLYVAFSNGSVYNLSFKYPMLFDLTAIFGSGNEPSTLEDFKKAFPLQYYSYNAGSILSAKSASLISRGKNQFSALNTFIPVIGGEEYEISGISAGGVLYQYDASKNLIDTSDTFTDTVDIEMEENTAFVKISATTYEDIMFYLTFPEDGGVYNEPYVEPRVETVTLPNIELRSVGDVKDIAYSAGGGKRRIGIVNLGDLNWLLLSDNKFAAGLSDILAPTLYQFSNIVCIKYKVLNSDWYGNVTENKTILCQPNKALIIKDTSYETAASLKTALNGVYLLYILGTETNISLSENPGWTELVYTDNFGTIEFTTSPAQVPQVEQPYFIRYTVSLVEFLDTAYVKCDGDGNNIATEKEIEEIRKGTDTVGLARASESLTPYSEESGATDTTPFIMQTAGGSSDIGSQAQLKALRGNSVAFNQLVQNGNFESDSGWYTANSGTITASNNVCHFVKTQTGRASFYRANDDYPAITNHKYLMIASIKPSINITAYFECGNSYQSSQSLSANVWTTIMFIASPTTFGGFKNVLRMESLSIDATADIKNYMMFDLTVMFGAGNEPTSVVEFTRLFPNPYYEYNAGELLSSKVNGIKNVGYNAFDGEIEGGTLTDGQPATAQNTCRSKNFIKVIAGQKYTLENIYDSTYIQNLVEYDGNKKLILQTNLAGIVGRSKTLTDNTHFVKFTLGKSGTGWGTTPPSQDVAQVCFHLTWDGSRTGYEPYESNTYPLPNVELRSAGSAYDELKPDGTLIRRIGVVDLGTLTWQASGLTTETNHIWYVNNFNGKVRTPNLLSVKYAYVEEGLYSTTPNTVCVLGDNSLRVNTGSSSSTPTGLLFYELATTTEEQTEYTFAETTPIDDFGTQEFLYDSDIAIPVPQGNEFFYPVDYKAFIDSLGGREDIEYDASEVVSHTELQEALANFLSSISGYDATKNQTLKNVSGTFTWVDDE